MEFLERVESGRVYNGEQNVEFKNAQIASMEKIYDYNQTRPTEYEKRDEMLRDLLGDVGRNPWIETPFHVAFGFRTHVGDNFYANFNLTLVDDVDIYIGNDVMIAPNVTISVTGHPVHADMRRGGDQFSFPVHIEDDVWIGAGVIILPGVTIGARSVIGAGSVVTKDIPADVVAVGNPCRVIRPITEEDRIYYAKGRRFDD